MTTLETLSVLFITAAFFGWISVRWLRLPLTVGTMLLTVLVSLALGGAGDVAPHLHTWAENLSQRIDLENIILHGMLPLLLFAGAFQLDLDELAREKLAVSVLSIAGTLISVCLVGVLMFLLSGLTLPWIQCLIFGALISPTDPIAVLEMLRRVGVPKAIQAQLAGESLFNDGIGAVLFLALLEVARGQAPTPWSVAWMLVLKAGGGVLLGIAAAWLASQMMRRSTAYQVDILFTIALALGGYATAEAMSLSAPLEAVIAGIALRHFNRCIPCERIPHDSIEGFWSVIDEIQNSVLFVLLGFETMAITLNGQTFLKGFAAIVSVNAVRLGLVAVLLALLRLVVKNHRSSVLVLTWGGLRGGLSTALALSVPAQLGRSWILGATYVVVLFSIVVQGGSMDWVLKRWNGAQKA